MLILIRKGQMVWVLVILWFRFSSWCSQWFSNRPGSPEPRPRPNQLKSYKPLACVNPKTNQEFSRLFCRPWLESNSSLFTSLSPTYCKDDLRGSGSKISAGHETQRHDMTIYDNPWYGQLCRLMCGVFLVRSLIVFNWAGWITLLRYSCNAV